MRFVDVAMAYPLLIDHQDTGAANSGDKYFFKAGRRSISVDGSDACRIFGIAMPGMQPSSHRFKTSWTNEFRYVMLRRTLKFPYAKFERILRKHKVKPDCNIRAPTTSFN